MVDQAYPYRLVYFGQPNALSNGNKSNFLTTRAPRLIRCVCTALANEFMKDDAEKAYWLALAVGEVNELNVEADMELQGMELEVIAT